MRLKPIKWMTRVVSLPASEPTPPGLSERRWRDTGFKRLELGSNAQYTWTQSRSVAAVRATGNFPAAGYRGWLQLESQTDAAKTYVLFFEAPDQPSSDPPGTFEIRERYPASDARPVFINDSAGVQQIH